MKKLIALSIFSSALFCGISPVKADYDRYGIEMGRRVLIYNDEGDKWYSAITKIYKYNSQTGNRILLKTNQHCPVFNTRQEYIDFDSGNDRCEEFSSSQYTEYDEKTEKIIVKNEEGNKQWSYDIDSNTWSWEDAEDYTISHQIPLIRQSANGVTSIGQNSLNFKETDKKLDLWGTNLEGEKVPVNVTSGLLINGRDVEQSINNVGAMSAALTGLPTVPTNTKIACGLGTGTHGGDLAFSGGCASKVNEKLSINYAASMSMPGQDFAGDFVDQFSARAGFVWQLGESNKPIQISLKDQKNLEEKIKMLETKNEKVISQNAKLLERLEKLEKLENIAFKFKEEEKYRLSKSI